MPRCNKHNEIHVRTRDGQRSMIIRCAAPDSIHFTRDVTEEQCSECPFHLAAVAIEDSPAPKTPSFPRRVKTWAEAVVGWKIAGSPERSQEEIDRIYQQFCRGCSWRDPEKNICRGCGCGVSKEGHAIFNKIRMATQHCPRTLW